MAENNHNLEAYDQYIGRLFAQEDDSLSQTREQMQKEGLPRINVSSVEGKLLNLLARIIGAKRILEIGTLGGYSATWLARALPEDGKMVTLEIDPHHADVARKNLEHAGLSSKVEVRVGPALDSLNQLKASNEAPFDLVFIDADKEAYPVYLDKVIPLTRSGGLILGDNALPGYLLEGESNAGIARFNAAAASHPELTATIIPLFREGVDGLLVSRKK